MSNPGATSPTPSAAGYSTSRGKACGHNVTFPVQPAALPPRPSSALSAGARGEAGGVVGGDELGRLQPAFQ